MFIDKVLTFSSDPVWHHLDHGAAFVDKVRSLVSAHWGMSTDFAKEMRKITEMVCSDSLEQHDVPLCLTCNLIKRASRAGMATTSGTARSIQCGTPYMRKSRSCSTRWACKCTGAS